MSALIWKRGLPDKPGWYWRRDARPDFITKRRETVIVHVRDYARKLAVGNSTIEGWLEMEQAEWAGPIQLPEEAGVKASGFVPDGRKKT